MDIKTLIAFHEKLVDAGKAECAFDDVDRRTLKYLFRVLHDVQDLKEIRDSLRRRVAQLEEQATLLKAERQILRRTIVTAGLPDPFADVATDSFLAEDVTRVNRSIEETPHSKLPKIEFE